MNNQHSVNTTTTPNWLAIFSLFIGVTSLIAAEFIPISLLTAIATDFTITEGKAGQSITMVGIFAVITSLLLAPLTSKINRRTVLLILSLLLVCSNVIVAIAPNYSVMLIGRMLLGICVGGFWSMTSAVVLQLVPTHYVSRALSIVYAGVSVATIISLPMASYLGLMIGWRNVFWLSAGLSLVALLCQVSSLPSLPSNSANNFGNMFTLLKQRWIQFGIISTIFSYGGYHIVFTYLQPFLEHNLVLPATTLTSMLLLFGICNCLGTVAAGLLLDRFFNVIMLGLHIILTIIAILLFINNHNTYVALILVMLWGWLFGFIPVGWSTWITRTLANKADIAGGLSVAAIQFSISLAAGIGGWTFDHLGMKGIFITAAVIFLVEIVTIIRCFAGYRRITGHKV